MKAMTILQPFAWAIAVGAKPVENRTKRTAVRGEFLIHAGKRLYPNYDEVCRWIEGEHGLTVPRTLKLGGIVGSANLTGCVDPEANKGPWSIDGFFGWQLADRRELPFVPCMGALGFWTVPDAIVAQLGDALLKGRN